MFYSSTITGEAAPRIQFRPGDAGAGKYREGEVGPRRVGIEWSGLSYQEKKQSGQTGLVIMLAFLFVFLFLAAQYESWSVPVAVLLSLPIACVGSIPLDLDFSGWRTISTSR